MDNKDVSNKEKNRIELSVAGIKIRVLTSESQEYMKTIAKETEERVNSFTSDKPAFGIDTTQRLLMSCFTFIDEKNKIKDKYENEIEHLTKAMADLQEKQQLFADEKKYWEEKYKNAQIEFENLAVENESLKEKNEENKQLIDNIRKEMKETSNSALRTKEVEKNNRNKIEKLEKEINNKDTEIFQLTKTLASNKEQMTAIKNIIVVEDEDFELLDDEKIKNKMEEVNILIKLYEEEQKNEKNNTKYPEY